MESFSYGCMVAWANICKWGWWTARKAKALWVKAPDRCRVYLGIITGVVLFFGAMAVFADHATTPDMSGHVQYFHLASATGPISCDPVPDSDGLHVCWPYAMTDEGPVFGNHGWCFAETNPFTEGGRWLCSGERSEALDMKGETLDGEVI